MPADPDETYTREIIRVVRELTEAVVTVRTDVNRAVNPLYQRIVRIERHYEDDGQNRAKRQQVLDARFDAQDKALAALQLRSNIRLIVEIALIVAVVATIMLIKG